MERNAKTEEEEAEANFRNMIMSCLTYGDNIFTSISMWTGKPYADEYIDILGYEKAMEIYNDQKRYFDECCMVEKDVYTDSEGVTYNRLIEKWGGKMVAHLWTYWKWGYRRRLYL